MIVEGRQARFPCKRQRPSRPARDPAADPLEIVGIMLDHPEMTLDVANTSDLLDWLEHREIADAYVIVARASLRTTPRLAAHHIDKQPSLGAAALRVLSANVVVCAATLWPQAEARNALLRLASRAKAQTGHAPGFELPGGAAHYAASTVVSGASTPALARTQAAESVLRSARAYAEIEERIFQEITDDCRALETATQRATVLSRPLWEAAPPPPAARDWSALQQQLLDLKQHFEPWIAWYRDRLIGRETDGVLEAQLTSIHDQIGSQTTGRFNAKLARLIAAERRERPNEAAAPAGRLADTGRGRKDLGTLLGGADEETATRAAAVAPTVERAPAAERARSWLGGVAVEIYQEFRKHTVKSIALAIFAVCAAVVAQIAGVIDSLPGFGWLLGLPR